MSRVPTPGKAKGLRTGDPVRRPYRRRARRAAGPPRARRDAVGHSGHRGQHPRCPPATRKNGEWIYGKSKSDASADRIVPLAPWLTDELRDYLTTVHPFAGKHRVAPLFPGRRNRHVFDWAKRVRGKSVRALPATRLPSPGPWSCPLPRSAPYLRHHEPER